MMDENINKNLLEFEMKMSEAFLERNAASMVDESPKDIIEKYIEWRHNRYTVIDQDDMFMVCDMYNPGVQLAVIFKIDPDAFNHAWTIAEELNNLPKDYCSINGKLFELDQKSIFSNFPDTSVRESFKENRSIICDPYTIHNVIEDNICNRSPEDMEETLKELMEDEDKDED